MGILIILIKISYSSFIELITSSLAALEAGYKPDKNPTQDEKNNTKVTRPILDTAIFTSPLEDVESLDFSIVFITKLIKLPISNPTTPPEKPIAVASPMKIFISPTEAPTTFITPISFSLKYGHIHCIGYTKGCY